MGFGMRRLTAAATALLLVVPGSMVAQEDGPAALSITILEPPIEMTDEVSIFAVESNDPRATGELSRTSAVGMAEEDGQTFMVLHESALLENEGGTWTGPIVTHFHAGADGPPTGGSFWELEGTGDYEGLSMVLSKIGTEDAWGIIVPSDVLPEQPAAPAR